MKTIPQKDSRIQPKIKTEMRGKGFTVHAGLLPVLNFMGKLLFRKVVGAAVRKERGANPKYEFVDAVQIIVTGLIAGATSMVQVVKGWADELLQKMAGCDKFPCYAWAHYKGGKPERCCRDDRHDASVQGKGMEAYNKEDQECAGCPVG